MSLHDRLCQAAQGRQQHRAQWSAEGTESYRLFHGVAEGRPGLSVDRYGPLLLAQISSTRPLDDGERAALRAFLNETGPTWVLAERQGNQLVCREEAQPGLSSSTFWCRELGLEFAICLARAHRDPQLFLDFRAAKRRLKQLIARRPGSLLNLFAYTCSVSAHARHAGASEVWSVDFSGGNLRWGDKNLRRNRLSGTQPIEADCLAVLWALNGSPQRRGRGSPPAWKPRSFDLVVVDPPPRAQSRLGRIDLVKDPETIYGPAWQAVAPGGALMAANNVAQVSHEEFEERLRKHIQRRQTGGLEGWEWIPPDPDFPSFDGRPPLKVALLWKSAEPAAEESTAPSA